MEHLWTKKDTKNLTAKRDLFVFYLVFISFNGVELLTMKAPGEVAKFTHEINNFYVIVKL